MICINKSGIIEAKTLLKTYYKFFNVHKILSDQSNFLVKSQKNAPFFNLIVIFCLKLNTFLLFKFIECFFV